MYRIKNWDKYQHYKNRRPAWIKLYRDLLDDIEWFSLSDGASKLLVMCWLIASEADGELPGVEELSFRVRMDKKKLSALLSSLSHWIEEDASNLLADCKQPAILEREKEREEEKERETEEEGNDASRFSVKALMELWNTLAHPNLTRVQVLNGTREVHARGRIRSMPEKGDWERVIQKINCSKFLTGQVYSKDRKPFKCTFDWMLSPTNLTKILEGNYDDKS